MDPDLSFGVIVWRKIPYLSTFLFQLLGFLFFALLVIDLFFLPTIHSSDEMKVAYYILVIPNIVKTALNITGAGILIALPLYLAAKYHRNVILTFGADEITLTGKKLDIRIAIHSLHYVYCADPRTDTGFPAGKLTIYFERKDESTTKVRLRDYGDMDAFMSRLTQYKGIDFKMYDFDPKLDFENEA